MPDLLLELRSEEIPPGMQAAGAESLRREVEKRLRSEVKKRIRFTIVEQKRPKLDPKVQLEMSESMQRGAEKRLQREVDAKIDDEVEIWFKAQNSDWGNIQKFTTLRRLGLVFYGLPDELPSSTEELRGPRTNASKEALEGFKRSTSTTHDKIEERELYGAGGATALYAIREVPVWPLHEALAEILPEAVRAVRWPKSMRWGRGNFRWVRPLRGILCLISDGNRSRPVALDIEGIPCGAVTCGHPRMAPESFTIENVDSYESQLKQAQVILQAGERCKKIHKNVVAAAEVRGLELVEDPGLIEEIAGLVEWPVVFAGRIEKEFSGLPDDLLRVPMRKHQKFLSLRNPATGQISGFAGVADIEANDGGVRIRVGYERVLRARLKDAVFFWENDKRTGLETMHSKLSGMKFHADLGSMQKRSQRIAELAAKIAPAFSINQDWAHRAGWWAKADLCSETVREFPALQGIVGSLLLPHRSDGDPEIAEAIEKQYRTEERPVHFGFGLHEEVKNKNLQMDLGGNRNRLAATLALADRADMLWGFFATGKQPTSSRDPYALRRAALVILRTLIVNHRPLSLCELFDFAKKGYEKYGDMPSAAKEYDSFSLLEFMLDRLRVDLHEGGLGGRGYRHDIIYSVAHPRIPSTVRREIDDNPISIWRRIDFWSRLFVKKTSPEWSKKARTMLAAYRRCANILHAEDMFWIEGEPDSKYYEPAELPLVNALNLVKKTMDVWERYPMDALQDLAPLYDLIDPFFENVHINHSDRAIQENRMRLLAQVCRVMEKVADFSWIEDYGESNDE